MLILKELSMMKRFGIGALLVGLAVFPLRAEIVEQVLVRVNGDILTKSDFEQRQVAVLRTRPELANVSPARRMKSSPSSASSSKSIRTCARSSRSAGGPARPASPTRH